MLPKAYVTQWNSTRTNLEHMGVSAENLTREPERPPSRSTRSSGWALSSLLGSLAEACARYQKHPAIADLLQGVMSENSANRKGCVPNARIGRSGNRNCELSIRKRNAAGRPFHASRARRRFPKRRWNKSERDSGTDLPV